MWSSVTEEDGVVLSVGNGRRRVSGRHRYPGKLSHEKPTVAIHGTSCYAADMSFAIENGATYCAEFAGSTIRVVMSPAGEWRAQLEGEQPQDLGVIPCDSEEEAQAQAYKRAAAIIAPKNLGKLLPLVWMRGC